MTIDSVTTLVEALRYEHLLAQDQLAQLTEEILAQFDSPRALAKYLVQLGWLTVYQINHLFEDHAQDLVIGPYCIRDRLGEGGVSEVYKAWDVRKNRHVALKVLRQDLRCEPDAVRQFERELQAVTRLAHPNIVRTFDADRVGNTHYFAMECVEGTDLGKVVQLSGPLPVADACDCIRQVASGLQYAHTMGLVHRDIKPANLFLITPPGYDKPAPGITWKRPADPVIKILDWGLARLQGVAEGPDAVSAGTEEGMLVGTADYIAPEQARDPRLVDIRADIYSLGCTFYYLLTGQPPFPGSSLMQKILQHQQAEPPPICSLRPDVPEEVAMILHKMVAKQPEARYQIPLAVSVPLRRFCQGGTGSSSNGTMVRAAGSSANGTALRPGVNGTGSNPGLRPTAGGIGSLRRNG
ncbi:MAG: serine/threonine protein kinase [Planctomycetes bacterium]|nr:serine/threonine protein kinase [Planctomycetota bacterium]